jgi:hypothetical protein
MTNRIFVTHFHCELGNNEACKKNGVERRSLTRKSSSPILLTW